MLSKFNSFLYLDGTTLDPSWDFPRDNIYGVWRLTFFKYLVVVAKLIKCSRTKSVIKSLIHSSKFLILLGAENPPTQKEMG